MKPGILIAIYNRPNYLRECLWALGRLSLPAESIILMVDDCSTDAETKRLTGAFTHPTAQVYKHYNQSNVGIKQTLKHGYEHLFGVGCTHVINFDSDAIMRPETVTELLRLYMSGTLLTAFHSTNTNRDGSQRHVIKQEFTELYLKESVGGINFCADAYAFKHLIEPVLNVEHGNWDYMSCIRANGAYCLKKSLVQHIGFDSSLNHYENPDVADSFSYFDLPDVTLICVDNNAERIQGPLKKCTEYLGFGQVVTLHPNITSKDEYSRFCIKELYKHVPTSHMLIFQYDGFVNNWKAWDESWLQWDYIGAPWYYNDGMAVGNGGFSLRSRRLMEIVANDNYIRILHPEDHHICRTYRTYLEAQYGVKFAPVEVAERFAFEGFNQPEKYLSDQFGVHGLNPRRSPAPPSAKSLQKYVVNQFLSLGDILFIVPLIRALMAEGNTMLWPIDKRYMPIAKHFPDINFVDKDTVRVNYEYKGKLPTPYGTLLPYRFASELTGKTLRDCMRAKYEMYGHDYMIWRQLYWKRDIESEQRLIKLLQLPKRFNLVNRYYGHEAKMTITPQIDNGLPIVEMRNIDGFTLVDWLGVVEMASEIHASNSSLNYLLELMLLDVPVYLYKRNHWGEQEFEYTRYLWTNECFRFVE